jgi:hypothetical protein
LICASPPKDRDLPSFQIHVATVDRVIEQHDAQYLGPPILHGRFTSPRSTDARQHGCATPELSLYPSAPAPPPPPPLPSSPLSLSLPFTLSLSLLSLCSLSMFSLSTRMHDAAPARGSRWARTAPAAGRWGPSADSAPARYRRHRAPSTGPVAEAVRVGGGGPRLPLRLCQDLAVAHLASNGL